MGKLTDIYNAMIENSAEETEISKEASLSELLGLTQPQEEVNAMDIVELVESVVLDKMAEAGLIEQDEEVTDEALLMEIIEEELQKEAKLEAVRKLLGQVGGKARGAATAVASPKARINAAMPKGTKRNPVTRKAQLKALLAAYPTALAGGAGAAAVGGGVAAARKKR